MLLVGFQGRVLAALAEGHDHPDSNTTPFLDVTKIKYKISQR